MSKFDRHMARPVVMTLENNKGEKDDFLIKPLPFKYMPDLYKLIKVMSKIDFKHINELPEDKKEEAFKEMFDKLPQDAFTHINLLIDATLEISYPEVPKEQRDYLASAHYFELLNSVMEANLNAQPKG